MAYRPCLSCGQRFFGPSFYTYVTWFDGEARYGNRLVQCGECAAELRNPVLERADALSDSGWTEAPGAPPISGAVRIPPESSELAALPGSSLKLSDQRGRSVKSA
jgi:hypothetical protein